MAITAEQRRVYERARYAADPEKKKARARARYEANRDEIKAQQAARYRANPEKQLTHGRRWAEQNPERARAARRAGNARRRARMADGDFTGQDWLDLLDEFDNACAYCQARGVKLEVEHMTPLARGGRHTKANIVPACESCNDRKGARTIFGFLAAS